MRKLTQLLNIGTMNSFYLLSGGNTESIILETILLVLSGGVLGLMTVCIVGNLVLARRYKKFFETTEEGKRLYCALCTKDKLGSKHDKLLNQMYEVRDRIDELEYYFPEVSQDSQPLCRLKAQYKDYSDELDRTRESMVRLENYIKETVDTLPKKYRGVLEYNWKDIEIKTKKDTV